MGSVGGESDGERIYVAVRARPLNHSEMAKNDSSDWECINDTTIIFKNSVQERSMLPTTYTFDRVFGSNSPTKQVYEEAAKKIALSVLSGINSTIFAYGQTGSGKTFTMQGITECAIADMYHYIRKHRDRKFVLKFCAMEIYNEAVRDLLQTDATSLRLLDDPERGTVVANLTEVTLNDLPQLKELLSICEAQRHIGETSLNHLSSRSHQILRLTVESEARQHLGEQSTNTLTASVSFVDLAGSERASQAVSAGTRLKEGGHINRSLLTLGTVIRKLSKGGKGGHIPYRDSKLTRILQTSLGGNARTAIICTMSPAHSHVEQSRNTLHFANCAKKVHMNAQVNVVMSEKALVKQLQKELARLESELKNIQSQSHSGASKTALKEKELLIQKMDKEIRELTHQRDMAQTRVENMLRSGGDQYMYNQDRGSWTDEYPASEASELMDPLRLDVASSSDRFEGIVANKSFSEEQFLISTRVDIDKYFGPDPCQGMENDFNMQNSAARTLISRTLLRNASSTATTPRHRERMAGRSLSSSDFGATEFGGKADQRCVAILESIMNGSGRRVAREYEKASQIEQLNSENASIALSRKNSGKQTQSMPSHVKTLSSSDAWSRQSFRDSVGRKSLNEKQSPSNDKMKQREVSSNEFSRVIESEALKQTENDLENAESQSKKEKTSSCSEEPGKADKERKSSSPEETVDEMGSSKTKDREEEWKAEFEKQKREIIKLWDACHIPLVHRSYFCLLFKGDPSDAVYMEVEYRRLSFLKTEAASTNDEIPFSPKALQREREMLSRRMLKKLNTKEREDLFQKWGIDLKSKQRRLQLCSKLWTETDNMEHVEASAAIVAKLAGLKEADQAPREMFGLSLAPTQATTRAFSWRHHIPSLI